MPKFKNHYTHSWKLIADFVDMCLQRKILSKITPKYLTLFVLGNNILLYLQFKMCSFGNVLT